jgi:hypothetical protein
VIRRSQSVSNPSTKAASRSFAHVTHLKQFATALDEERVRRVI